MIMNMLDFTPTSAARSLDYNSSSVFALQACLCVGHVCVLHTHMNTGRMEEVLFS